MSNKFIIIQTRKPGTKYQQEYHDIDTFAIYSTLKKNVYLQYAGHKKYHPSPTE
jgi:hypothetical protein